MCGRLNYRVTFSSLCREPGRGCCYCEVEPQPFPPLPIRLMEGEGGIALGLPGRVSPLFTFGSTCHVELPRVPSKTHKKMDTQSPPLSHRISFYGAPTCPRTVCWTVCNVCTVSMPACLCFRLSTDLTIHYYDNSFPWPTGH